MSIKNHIPILNRSKLPKEIINPSTPLLVSKYAHELKNLFLTISSVIDDINLNYNEDSTKLNFVELNNSKFSLRHALEFLLSLSHYGMNLIMNINMIGNHSFNGNNPSAKITQCDHVAPFNLVDTLQFCVSIFQIRQKIEKQSSNVVINHDIRIPSDFKVDSISEIRLKQVLINLLSNSYKFTRKGSIVLSCYFIDKEKKTIRIKVIDTGTGMHKSEQAELFKPFICKQSNLNNYGSGLGMCIIKEILESFGIKLYFESVQFEGSSFWFDLDFKDLETKKKVHIKNIRSANSISILQIIKISKDNNHNRNNNINKDKRSNLIVPTNTIVKIVPLPLSSQKKTKFYHPSHTIKIYEEKNCLSSVIKLDQTKRSGYDLYDETIIDNSQDECGDLQEGSTLNAASRYTLQTKGMTMLPNSNNNTLSNSNSHSHSNSHSNSIDKKLNNSMKAFSSYDNPIIPPNQLDDNNTYCISSHRILMETAKKRVNKSISSLDDQILFTEEKICNVLVVDDESLTSNAAKKSILNHCINNKITAEITILNNGIECLYKAYQLAQGNIPLNLIIIDENMPYLKGSVICQLIQSMKEFSNTKLCLMSSQEMTLKMMKISCYMKPLTMSSIQDIFSHMI